MRCELNSYAFRGRSRVATARTVAHSATGSCIVPNFGRQASGRSSHNGLSRATPDYRSN